MRPQAHDLLICRLQQGGVLNSMIMTVIYSLDKLFSLDSHFPLPLSHILTTPVTCDL